MKKGLKILSGLVIMMLLSFTPHQEKKVIRLKNGNYVLNDLIIEKDDIEAMQKSVNDMTAWLYENENEKDKDKYGRKKYEDLMSIFESAEGYEKVLAYTGEKVFYVLNEEVQSDVIKTNLKLTYFKNHKKEEEFRGQIDNIMSKYLK